MAAGSMDRRVSFYGRTVTESAPGVAHSGWSLISTVWGRLTPQSGREQVESGRLEASTPATLVIRWSASAASLDATDKATIDGVDYQIRSVFVREVPRRSYIEMVVERGVAQ